jgi:hypothetical protein
MPAQIGREDGRWIVANPVQPQENFADRWADHPERAERFGAWLRRLQADLRAAEEESGMHRVAARLSESFGREPVDNTILPWISEWLFFYELWLFTGDWLGGGHGTPASATAGDEAQAIG